jgi:hypothetical protein
VLCKSFVVSSLDTQATQIFATAHKGELKEKVNNAKKQYMHLEVVKKKIDVSRGSQNTNEGPIKHCYEVVDAPGSHCLNLS